MVTLGKTVTERVPDEWGQIRDLGMVLTLEVDKPTNRKLRKSSRKKLVY